MSNDSNNPYIQDPDVLLMLKVKEGDGPSFEKLMEKYFKRILNFIYRLIGDQELSEDLTQETFIKIFKSAKRYEPRAKFQTFLYTVAKNVALNELRKKKGPTISINTTFQTDDGFVSMQYEDKKELTADVKVIKEEKAVAVRMAIYALPKNQRIAVILRRYDGLSYSQIADTLKVSEKAVKSLLNRAKENLKDLLFSYMKEEI